MSQPHRADRAREHRLIIESHPFRRHARRWLVLVAIAATSAAFAACSSDADDTKGDGTIVIDPQGEAPTVDNPNKLSTTPALRRLTVDQLDASVQVVAGKDLMGNNIYWSYGAYNAYDDRALGQVLGRPDYVSVTEEDTSPSSLYIKFAQDMARSVCDQLVKTDLGRLPGQERTLWRLADVDGNASDAEITANVQYLVLRFLGLDLAADDGQVLALKQLYEAGIASVDSPELSETPIASEGWRAVCIALFEDPAFHLH